MFICFLIRLLLKQDHLHVLPCLSNTLLLKQALYLKKAKYRKSQHTLQNVEPGEFIKFYNSAYLYASTLFLTELEYVNLWSGLWGVGKWHEVSSKNWMQLSTYEWSYPRWGRQCKERKKWIPEANGLWGQFHLLHTDFVLNLACSCVCHLDVLGILHV